MEQGGGFSVTLFKNNLTTKQLAKLGLNDRQIDALLFFKEKGEITTSEYMVRYNISERTARNDLNNLIENKFIKREGQTNMAKYILVR